MLASWPLDHLSRRHVPSLECVIYQSVLFSWPIGNAWYLTGCCVETYKCSAIRFGMHSRMFPSSLCDASLLRMVISNKVEALQQVADATPGSQAHHSTCTHIQNLYYTLRHNRCTCDTSAPAGCNGKHEEMLSCAHASICGQGKGAYILIPSASVSSHKT